MNEEAFQSWYRRQAKRFGLNPDPDDPRHFYDYRAAYRAGKGPDDTGHWPSEFKREGHPNLIIDGIDTRTGKSVNEHLNKVAEEAKNTPAQLSEQQFIEMLAHSWAPNIVQSIKSGRIQVDLELAKDLKPAERDSAIATAAYQHAVELATEKFQAKYRRAPTPTAGDSVLTNLSTPEKKEAAAKVVSFTPQAFGKNTGEIIRWLFGAAPRAGRAIEAIPGKLAVKGFKGGREFGAGMVEGLFQLEGRPPVSAEERRLFDEKKRAAVFGPRTLHANPE